MRIIPAVTVLASCLAADALRADPEPRKANSVERIVRFEYPVTSKADREQDVRVCLALPQSNPRQGVMFVYPEPGYQDLATDAYGNQIAIYNEKAMKPGEVRRRGWIAAVRTYAAVYEAGPEPARLSDADRARYTADSPKYRIDSAEIRSLRDTLIKPGMTDYEKAMAVFRYLAENVKYFRDDKWDTAPEVLSRKQGSCSEYTYATIALLRACDVPCRYTGGSIVSTGNKTRYDPKVHEDAVFHRWTEAFLERYGWYPLDAARAYGATQRFGNYLNFCGRLTADSLQTYCGDGGDDSYIGWDYVAAARGTVKDSLRADGVFFWIEAPPEKLPATVEAVRKAAAEQLPSDALGAIAKDTLQREVLFLLMNHVDRTRWPAIAEELYRVRHPGAVYLSIYCEHLGMTLPAFLAFPLLTDEYLRSEILKHRTGGRWDWAAFERWWRKARPEISFSEERMVFILNTKQIDLN